jgi:hypothetical protein
MGPELGDNSSSCGPAQRVGRFRLDLLRPHRAPTNMRRCLAALVATLLVPATAFAAQPYACGGAALAGGAQLLCSHIDPKAPAQSCNFSWSLMTTDDVPQVVSGTFLLVPGSSNVVVYQGFGFESPLANPIIVCEGKPG